MSLSELSEHDLDRLADYVAGVLDPPASAEVVELIATDPVWAAAFAELVGAGATVRAQLQSYGQAEVDPMPADVVARIDAALAAVAPVPAVPVTAAVIPIDAARRARRRRWTGLAAAAGLLVAVGTGVVVVRATHPSLTPTGAADAGVAAPADASGSGQGSVASPPRVPAAAFPTTHSGLDYTADTLAATARSAESGKVATQPGPFAGAEQPSDDTARGRFDTPDARQACLDQILHDHPGQVLSVDVARYQGAPAVIVVIRQDTGTIAVAAGEQLRP